MNAKKVHLKPNKQHQRKGPQCNRLNTELKHSLHSWLWHLQHGKRRDLCAYGDGRNDIVIFTDGWVANTHTNEEGIPGVAGRIGAVMFHKSLPKPLCFEMDIPEKWAWAWKERDTQIVLVEFIAPPFALYTWKDFILGRTVIMFNDNTTAENILGQGSATMPRMPIRRWGSSGNWRRRTTSAPTSTGCRRTATRPMARPVGNPTRTPCASDGSCAAQGLIQSGKKGGLGHGMA